MRYRIDAKTRMRKIFRQGELSCRLRVLWFLRRQTLFEFRFAERGWAVSPGERFRFRTPPGIRITTTSLDPADTPGLAAAISEAVTASPATYAG